MKGNYSYTTDGGLTYIVNTITTNLGNNEPSDNSLYNCCPYEIGGEFDFTFKDIIYNKENCSAIFKFVGVGETQLYVKLKKGHINFLGIRQKVFPF